MTLYLVHHGDSWGLSYIDRVCRTMATARQVQAKLDAETYGEKHRVTRIRVPQAARRKARREAR